MTTIVKTVWEIERKYNAVTMYDKLSSINDKTLIIIDTGLFKPKATAENYNIRTTFGHLAKITSMDGMCHLTFNIVTTSKDKFFEIEFYDILAYNYGVPKFQKVYCNIEKYIDNIKELPESIDDFVQLLITTFEKLSPALEAHRNKYRKDIATAEVEKNLAEHDVIEAV